MMREENLKNEFTKKLELTLLLTKSVIKSRYRKTFAGFFWVVLSPLLTFLVQALIFKNILKLNTDNYYLFLASGIIPWIFLTTSIIMTNSCFVVNRPILMSFKLEPWIFILSQVADNVVTFLVSFLVLIILDFHFSSLLFIKVMLFGLSSLILIVTTFYTCFLLAILYVFVRDTQFILQFCINLLYFVTPIFYPKELIPLKFQWIININPFYILIRPFQFIFWKFDLDIYMNSLFTSINLMFIVVLITLFYWNRKKHEIYFRI